MHGMGKVRKNKAKAPKRQGDLWRAVKWTLFYGVLETALEEGDDLRTLLFALGLIATVLTMSYILWMFKRVFLGKIPENLSKVKDGSWYMLAPMMVLAGFTIVVGIYPDIFLQKIMPYMQGVLGG